jgi:hypothetical protein
MTTDQKGAIAETAVAHAAVKLGIDVYRPVVEGGRYDLVSASARASFASSASGPADAEASLQSGVPRVAGPRTVFSIEPTRRRK